MRVHWFAAAAALSLTAAGVAIAALPKSRALAILHVRHEGMEKIGDTNKLLRREITSSSPFMPAIQSGAATIAGLSIKASGWFPRGTGPELGKTGAKPEIWQNQQDFVSKLHAFQGAARAFNAAARAGDMNAIKARYADLNGACKACHDKYRTEMHH
jgi:cytochrome c556